MYVVNKGEFDKKTLNVHIKYEKYFFSEIFQYDLLNFEIELFLF